MSTPTPYAHPVKLKGRHVTLEPLLHDHHAALVEAVRDGELWKLWYAIVASPEDMRADIEQRPSGPR